MNTVNIFSGSHCFRLAIAIWIFVVGIIRAEPPAGEGTDFSGSNVFWGNETNGVSMALLIAPLSSSNHIPIHCTPIVKNSRSQTNHLWVWFPPIESCCQMSLMDEKGNSVPKTAKGKSLGKPITEPMMLKDGPNIKAGYKMRPLAQNKAEMLSDFSFDLQNYFEVTNSGKYRLTYEMRVVLPQSTKGNYMTLHTTNLPTTALPSVIADVEVKPSTGK